VWIRAGLELGLLTWRQWMLLSSIFAVQMSMNFNTSVFPNAVPLISEEYGVSEQAARVCQMIFLVLYAFGRSHRRSLQGTQD